MNGSIYYTYKLQVSLSVGHVSWRTFPVCSGSSLLIGLEICNRQFEYNIHGATKGTALWSICSA